MGASLLALAKSIYYAFERNYKGRAEDKKPRGNWEKGGKKEPLPSSLLSLFALQSCRASISSIDRKGTACSFWIVCSLIL